MKVLFHKLGEIQKKRLGYIAFCSTETTANGETDFSACFMIVLSLYDIYVLMLL